MKPQLHPFSNTGLAVVWSIAAVVVVAGLLVAGASYARQGALTPQTTKLALEPAHPELQQSGAAQDVALSQQISDLRKELATLHREVSELKQQIVELKKLIQVHPLQPGGAKEQECCLLAPGLCHPLAQVEQCSERRRFPCSSAACTSSRLR